MAEPMKEPAKGGKRAAAKRSWIPVSSVKKAVKALPMKFVAKGKKEGRKTIPIGTKAAKSIIAQCDSWMVALANALRKMADIKGVHTINKWFVDMLVIQSEAVIPASSIGAKAFGGRTERLISHLSCPNLLALSSVKIVGAVKMPLSALKRKLKMDLGVNPKTKKAYRVSGPCVGSIANALIWSIQSLYEKVQKLPIKKSKGLLDWQISLAQMPSPSID